MELIEWSTQMSFARYGVLPRDVQQIYGAFTSPFLHGEWSHLFSNSLPFIVLSSILFLMYRKVSYLVFILIYVITGLLVWALARGGTYHIGASGLVYGLFGFVFFSGIFRLDMKSIGISLAVGFFYGGMIWGVLPNQEGISWESHLLGGLAGALLAYLFRKEDIPPSPQWMEEPESRRNFADFIDRMENN